MDPTRGEWSSRPDKGRYRTGVTERTDLPGEPGDDSYRHLFRDEPPKHPAAAMPGSNYFQPPTMRDADAASFFEDDDEIDAPSAPQAPPADRHLAPEQTADNVPAEYAESTGIADEQEAPVEAAPETPPTATPAPAREAETGRLFRSIDADPATGAIPALRGDERRHLHTVGTRGSHREPVVDTATVTSGGAEGAAHEAPEAPTGRRQAEYGKNRRRNKRTDSKRAAVPAAVPSGPGLRAIGVFVVVIAVTLLLGLVDVLLGPGLGPIFGVGLLLSSVYGAFAVRRDDAVYAVTAPPIAALLAVVTVGQLNAGASADSLTGRVIVAFFALADNWMWIIGSTLLALVIVVVRSMRARRA